MALPLHTEEHVDPSRGRRRRPNLQVVDTAPEAAPVAKPRRPNLLARVRATVASDWAGWWLLLTDPPALRTWLDARHPLRVPDDVRLRGLWRVDHWATGLLFAALSVVLFAAAGTARWVACHPARRWPVLAFVFVGVAWVVRAK